MMDLFQIKCFIHIVDQKSFTKAAFEVSISQSALSKNISKLEKELGIQLFDRSKRLATLTPAGHEFESYARKIQTDYDALLSAVKRFSTSGHLHIGSVEHMGRVGLTAPISSFLKQYPDKSVSIDIEKGDTVGLMNQLMAGKIDMAFIAHIISPISKTSNIDAYQLGQYRLYTLLLDEYHVIIGPQHKFAKRETISWQELAAERLVILNESYSLNTIIRETFRQCGLRPDIVFECDQVDTILGLVEENFGVSLLSKRIATTKYNVVAIRMDSPITRNTVLVIPKEVESHQRLAGQFAHHIINYYEDMTGGSSIRVVSGQS
ncbi:LysR family transcriptional regulator [Caproiciproducens sp. NJN-50]|nr:LysR family transcriptional regulator [Caproiciproducens sp. NJN-50]